MSVQGQNYFANMVKAPQILQGSPNYNVEVSEGQTPPGEFYPAQYLPTVLSENRVAGSAFVLMPGKVVAYDHQKRLIPAGLGLSFSDYSAIYNGGAGLGNADHATTQAYIDGGYGFYRTYKSLDVEMGVVGIDGAPVVEGDVVEASLLDGGFAPTAPIGIMRYSALMAPGSNPSNPATFTKHSYDTGGARAFTRWAYIQVPVVEVNRRVEKATAGSTGNMLTNQKNNTHRIRVYPEGAVTITTADGVTPLTTSGNGMTFQQVHTLTDLENQPWYNSNVIYFALQGRTLVFSKPIGFDGGDDWYVSYMPKVDLPFTCLKFDAGANVLGDSGLVNPNALMGAEVAFNYDSNFEVVGATGSVGNKALDAGNSVYSDYNMTVGRILDYKNGSNEDLALVRTYFRDYGLWQEQPGSATDGRNTQLSIVNAPKWIVRIAVNFESSFSPVARS